MQKNTWNLNRTTLYLVVTIFILSFGNGAVAFGGPTTCEVLQENFSLIKGNLALHEKTMTASDIEKANVDIPNYAGRRFSREFGDLARALKKDIDNWEETAKRCGTINPDALFTLRLTCNDVLTGFNSRWYSERVKGASKTAEPTNERLRSIGFILADREYAKCFVALEKQFFAKPDPAPASVPIKTKKVAWNGPLTLTMPTTFDNARKDIFASNPEYEPGLSIYCEPEDAQLFKAQLHGERHSELPAKGIFTIIVDPVISFDPASGKFSVEKDIGAHHNISLDRAEFRTRAASNVVRGTPTFLVSTEAVSETTRQWLYKLYIADGSKVWVISFTTGKQSNLSKSIWDTFIRGL